VLRLDLSDKYRAATAGEFDDPTTESLLQRRMMMVRLHGLNVPHLSITQALNLSDHMVENYPHFRVRRPSGYDLVLYLNRCSNWQWAAALQRSRRLLDPQP
jgi:hypothetical protein